jgi:hypothetical protein
MPNEAPVTTQQGQQRFVIAQELPAPAPVGNAVVSKEDVRKLGNFVGEWLNRRYSSARAVVRMKIVAFAGLLAFLGLGFTVKLASFSALTGLVGPVDFILTSPDPAQSISAVVAFMFAVSADIYAGWKTTEMQRSMFELAARPDIHPEVRSAILVKLQS